MNNRYDDIFTEQPPEKIYAKWKAALYIRLSKDDGDKAESNSVVSQKEILKAFVDKTEDMIVFDYYIDDGWSGTNFDRPGFQRMLDDIDNGLVNCVIVKDLSRFGRNYVQSGTYEEHFKDNGIRFIALQNNVDTMSENENSSIEILNIGINNIINETYAANTSASIKGTLTNNRKQGKFIGSFPTYGYLKDPDNHHKLIVDETAAEIIRMIYDKYRNGTSILGITKELNRMGIPNPSTYKKNLGWNYHHTSIANDGLWCDQTVRRILSNQMYIGNMVQGKNESPSYKSKRCRAVPRDKWIIVEGTHEAIIDKDVFDEVQALLKMRTKTSQKSGELDLFAGLLKCADCGRAMSKKTNDHPYGKYVYYRCVTSRKMDRTVCSTHSIRADLLEKAVLSSIQIMIDVALDIDSTMKMMKKSQPKNVSKIDKVLQKQQNELKTLKEAKLSLYPDWKSGAISKEYFLQLNENFDKKIAQVTNSITELEKESKTVPFSEENEFVTAFKKHKNIRKLTRPVLTALVDSVLVHEGGNITINFKFSDAFAEAYERLNQNEYKADIA